MHATSAFAGVALATILAAGCTAPVAAGLEESDANQVVVALDRAGIVAEKVTDPDAEGRWRVSVSRDDAAAALIALSQDNLPPRPTPGILDTMGESSIVPSRTAEHAKMVAGTAGDLERSLRGVDGVLDARIHLAVPQDDPLATGERKAKPTASVLLRYRGATVPMAAAEIQRLVAGAVAGLAPEDVAVVTSPVPDPPRSGERELARFGPITATRSSLGWARGILLGIVALSVTLAGIVIALWTRLRRVYGELTEARAADEQS